MYFNNAREQNDGISSTRKNVLLNAQLYIKGWHTKTAYSHQVSSDCTSCKPQNKGDEKYIMVFTYTVYITVKNFQAAYIRS
jgi:hypothetical protein